MTYVISYTYEKRLFTCFAVVDNRISERELTIILIHRRVVFARKIKGDETASVSNARAWNSSRPRRHSKMFTYSVDSCVRNARGFN